MRSHGKSRACYKGERPPEGSCEACRVADRKRMSQYRQTPKGRDVHAKNMRQWRTTAAGQLANIRGAARRRGGAAG